MEKLYTLFINESLLCSPQEVESSDAQRPIVYISGSFSNMLQRCSANEKEALTAYQSVLQFDLYLRGMECILHCNH